MNYKFGLYLDGELRDETNLDENDPEHAEYLFLHEFEWDILINRGDFNKWEVKLISIEPELGDDGTTNTFGGDTGIDADFYKKP